MHYVYRTIFAQCKYVSFSLLIKNQEPGRRDWVRQADTERMLGGRKNGVRAVARGEDMLEK